jgi:hypothetical protein
MIDDEELDSNDEEDDDELPLSVGALLSLVYKQCPSFEFSEQS